MQTIRYELIAAAGGQVAQITFDQAGSSVNTMCRQWQEELGQVTALVLADRDRLGAALKGLVLASAKSSFFAGADLKATMRLTPADAPAAFGEIERMKKHFRTLETLGIPVVACLNGAALGGGWEVALIAHYRIAVDDANIRLGLPEVTLGLMPGATGVTKMTRLLGLMGAQPYLLEGRLLSPAEALQLQLVHELVATPEQLLPAALACIAAHPQSAQPWDGKNYAMPGGSPASPALANALAVAPAQLKKTTRGRHPAPEAVLAAMVEGALVDYDTALRIESRYLARLMTGPVARNMINTFFFDLNAIRSGKSRPAGSPRFQPAKVGILGAGMMGAGIAWAQASRGIATVLQDLSLEKADGGKAYSARLAQARVGQGRMTPQAQQALLARITATADVADLAGCELIIEAVFENRALKAQVTRAAEPQLAPGGFFASNTSTLPITGLAQASARPGKFIGIHFFSPVDKMKLVEIIRGQATDDDTVARAFDYVQALGKVPIVVNDARGFYTSRTFGTMVMEGAAMLGEGLPAPVIENAALQAGLPVGPLALLDETALTLSVHVLEQTRADHAAAGTGYSATPGESLVERMVKELRRPGRAGGGGFYDYPAGAKKQLWPELRRLFEKPGLAWSVPEIQDRLLYRQAIETARCLAEGVLTSVSDANIGSIFGIGFPAWTGGAMQFIYGTGIEPFLRRAQELAQRHGAGFAVDAPLRQVIERHQPVY
ncbi:short chain enoyl-CoA hydratase / 3-hydroxyacyl-CoA dehydrogenase [Verminephrobacter eiseniae EF01-2]|uniref:enoyl-CoA hydratase n=1 Tax=Verminephrobacter eiseniae (strain EF01-2) TaxID=391735 RepID=A1WRA2_VEREI|nr:3-hydroxyacyl-CoA dehydrogenase NAD-binding domain-containing protein [Verminephrobacter eiseniae]ABM60159.1 short chain enoyl-CoA hydratase / 3-hydroxyacyl-CoA dehydrogenase [Verminephrobacter eiseniae EF01-2]